MTDPLLWLDGDPTDGRRVRQYEPEVPPAPPPSAAPPPAAPKQRGHFRAALAGGFVSAALVTGGAFAFGVVDTDGNPAAVNSGPALVGAKQTGDVAAIYAAARESVVSIQTRGGSGTGFVTGADGTIVTNAHVVGSATTVQVQFADDETASGARDGRRSLLRPRGREGGRRPPAQGAVARGLHRGPHRAARGRDRLAVRALADDHGGHRVRHRPPHPGAGRLPDRLGHPDRRADQPRQLGRSAARRAGARDRRQLADRVAERRERRDRVRGAVQHGPRRDPAPRARRVDPARVPRRLHVAAAPAASPSPRSPPAAPPRTPACASAT